MDFEEKLKRLFKSIERDLTDIIKYGTITIEIRDGQITFVRPSIDIKIK